MSTASAAQPRQPTRFPRVRQGDLFCQRHFPCSIVSAGGSFLYRPAGIVSESAEREVRIAACLDHPVHARACSTRSSSCSSTTVSAPRRWMPRRAPRESRRAVCSITSPRKTRLRARPAREAGHPGRRRSRRDGEFTRGTGRILSAHLGDGRRRARPRPDRDVATGAARQRRGDRDPPRRAGQMGRGVAPARDAALDLVLLVSYACTTTTPSRALSAAGPVPRGVGLDALVAPCRVRHPLTCSLASPLLASRYCLGAEPLRSGGPKRSGSTSS